MDILHHVNSTGYAIPVFSPHRRDAIVTNAVG